MYTLLHSLIHCASDTLAHSEDSKIKIVYDMATSTLIVSDTGVWRHNWVPRPDFFNVADTICLLSDDGSGNNSRIRRVFNTVSDAKKVLSQPICVAGGDECRTQIKIILRTVYMDTDMIDVATVCSTFIPFPVEVCTTPAGTTVQQCRVVNIPYVIWSTVEWSGGPQTPRMCIFIRLLQSLLRLAHSSREDTYALQYISATIYQSIGYWAPEIIHFQLSRHLHMVTTILNHHDPQWWSYTQAAEDTWAKFLVDFNTCAGNEVQ